jgi:3'-phosphoadenosine 5'-phosphosulfate sulfotransferase (PAPS reductase)/FAD synthetase
VFPLSNWTELDVWLYIHLEKIPVVPLYFAKPRPVVERDGMLIMVDDDRMPMKAGETPRMEMVRFRSLGCYPLSGALRSEASDLTSVIEGCSFRAHPATTARSTLTRRQPWKSASARGTSDGCREARRFPEAS